MNLRRTAARVLSRITKQGQSLTVALDDELREISADQDRAFVQALCYGTVRHYYRLEFMLNRLLRKPIKEKDSEIKALLLIGLYQLEHMRVKDHAAVSETVAALPKKQQYAKPLLNAVLRNYQRGRQALQAAADQDRCASTAHPAWLIEQIQSNWPEQSQRIFAENNRQAPMALRINQRRCSREHYLALLTERNIAAELPDFCGSAVVLQQPVPVEKLPGFADGYVSVQDTAAQLAADLLELDAGQRVLDVCAAPGGKAAHILEKQAQLAGLTAVDIDAERLQRVKQSMARLQLQAELLVGDALNPASWWDGESFHRILLDAPCSATGVIRRHPDIKLLRREQDIRTLQEVQKQMLRSVWRLLAPQGILLYATCSVLKQENEDRIRAFLAEHDDATEITIEQQWGMKRDHGRQILPGDAAMDGFYYAKIKKR